MEPFPSERAKSPILEKEIRACSIAYIEKMQNSLALAYRMENNSFDKTKEWDRTSTLFKSLFFNENGEINQEKLSKFRATSEICEEVFGDHFYYVDPKAGYTKAYLKAVDLVLEYHRYSKVINKELLASQIIADQDALKNGASTSEAAKILYRLASNTAAFGEYIGFCHCYPSLIPC